MHLSIIFGIIAWILFFLYMENNSELTAITRTKISVPTKILLQNDLLFGKILDFGCGKGFDVHYLKDLGFDIRGYDPYYQPNKPEMKFDTIICNYVLNVLEPYKWQTVIDEIKTLLNDGGIAYICVRRDIKNEGYRRHGKGLTYQVNVELDLEKFVENTKYCIYKLS